MGCRGIEVEGGMKTFFIATSNAGKQNEIEKFFKVYSKDTAILFPNASSEVKVDESGSTFEANALLKAEAYRDAIGDTSLFYVGDDSGIIIPALNDEPGVFTRRWVGREMTDEEILTHCLERMDGLEGDERKAIFQTVLAVVTPKGKIEYFRGEMNGHILKEPLNVELQPGFPFRSIFWIDGVNMPIYKLHDLKVERRGGFLSHRESAFRQLFLSDMIQ